MQENILRIVQKYIKGDERSFTIIAFPLPEIGNGLMKNYSKQTVKINMFRFRINIAMVQQSIIDALRQGRLCKGRGQRRATETYISVKTA